MKEQKIGRKNRTWKTLSAWPLAVYVGRPIEEYHALPKMRPLENDLLVHGSDSECSALSLLRLSDSTSSAFYRSH